MPDFCVEAFCSEQTNRFRDAIAKANKHLDPSDYELELICFRLARFGSKEKAEFCISLIRYQWPGQVLIEVGALQNHWLKRIIRVCCKYKTLMLMGAASASKTFGASIYAYNTWKSSPWNTSVYLSTTTVEAGEARIWGAIRDLHDKDRYKAGHRIDYRNMIVLQEDGKNKERDYRDSISAIAIKPGAEGRNAMGTISGRKNQNVIWACDELSAMDVGVLEARLNLLANPFSQFIGISNKPTEGDPMYIAAEPAGEKYPGGWTSVTPDDKGWTIKGGYCAYFDGEKSPNMGLPEGSGVPFPMLMTEEMRKNIEDASGGTDTIGYWTQVRGFPNSGEVQDTVLTTNLINAHKANEQPLWGTVKPECIAGLDLGFRKDGDPCVADFAKFGTSADGYRILAHEPDGITLRYSLNDKAPFEQQMADRFIDEAAKRDCHQVEVDVSGDGGIIAQQLVKRAAERDYKLQVHLCSFMGAPDENATFEIGGKRKPAKEIFDRKVSQLWYSYRLSVQNGVIRGLKFGSKAVTQLCQRKILMDEKKRWSVEPKKEMKLRIRRSPDEADSRCLCHSLAIRKGLTSSGMQPRKVIIPDFQDRVNPGRYSREQAGSSRYAGR